MNKKNIIVISGAIVFILLGVIVYFTMINASIQPALAPSEQISTKPIPNRQPIDSTVNSNLQTYQNQKYGFEFQYPKIWKTKSRAIGTGWGEKDFVWFDSGFSVSVSDTSIYSFDQLKEVPSGGIDPETIKETSLILDGNSATEITYTQVRDAGSGSKQMKKIVVSKNNMVYMIECVVSDCEKVMPTFKFTQNR